MVKTSFAGQNHAYMQNKVSLLIIGGYGQVGLQMAQLLAETQQYAITLAGRSETKARQAAQKTGYQTLGASFDLYQPTVEHYKLVNAHDVIVVCLDQPNDQFVRYCIAQSKVYFDITAQSSFITALQSLNTAAQQNNAFVLTSLGLCPGLSNLMTKEMIRRHPEADHFHTGILLGLGEQHGKAAIEWTLDNLANDFYSNGKRIKAYQGKTPAPFTAAFGLRNTYRFNFSDQHTLPMTYPGHTFSTGLTFDRSWLSALLHIAARLGITKLLKYARVRQAAIKAFAHPLMGKEVFGLSAQAMQDGKMLGYMAVEGSREAEITARLAYISVHKIMQSGLHRQGGVFDIQSVLSLQDIWTDMKQHFTETAHLP